MAEAVRVEREPDLGPDPLQHVAGGLDHQRPPVPLHQEVGRLRLWAVPVDIADDLSAEALGGRHAAELGPLSPLDLQEHTLAIVLDVFQLEIDELANSDAGAEQDADRQLRPPGWGGVEDCSHLALRVGRHLLQRDLRRSDPEQGAVAGTPHADTSWRRCG